MKNLIKYLSVNKPGQIVLIYLILLLTCCSKNSNNASIDNNQSYQNIIKQLKQDKKVKIEKVTEKMIHIDIYSLGTISHFKEVRVISQISGRIEKIYFDTGEKIMTNYLLCKLDTKFFQLDLDKKKASYEQAKSQYNLAEIKLKEAVKKVERQIQMIKKSRLELNEKEIFVKNLHVAYIRKKELLKIGGLSNEKFEEGELAYQKAQLDYQKAKMTMEAEEIGYRNIDIKNFGVSIPSNENEKTKLLIKINTQIEQSELEYQKSNLIIAENAYNTSKAYLNECFINAPFGGIISEKKAENGENISANTHIMTLIDIDKVYVKLNISEKDIGKIKTGMEIKLKVDAYSDLEFIGKIQLIEPVIDQKARTFTIKALVLNPHNRLKPGMFARCNIFIKEKKKIITIPIKSIVSKESNIGEIFVVKSGISFKKSVELGREIDDRVEILKGLSEGENVVVEGNRELSGNEKIIIIEN
jgi:RND family efflux transporter MFP subunit